MINNFDIDTVLKTIVCIKVREYSFLEFSCNNSLHVAGNTSTFRLQCPPTGQFPSVHERPVLEDGNYSARFLSGVELETKVGEDVTIRD